MIVRNLIEKGAAGALLVLVAATGLAQDNGAQRAREIGLGEAAVRAQQLAFRREQRIRQFREAAEAASSRRDYKQCSSELGKLLELAPGDEEAARLQARCDEGIEGQEKREAIEAERLSRSRVQMLLAEGRRAYGDRDFEKALEAFTKALEEEPENEAAQRYLERTEKTAKLVRKHQGEEAARVEARTKERERRKKERARESAVDELLRRGRDYFLFDEFDAAITAWSEVLSRSVPADREHQLARAWIQVAQIAKVQRIRQAAWKVRAIDVEAALMELEEKWVKSRARIREVDAGAAGDKIVSADRRALHRAAQETISLDFNNAHIRNVLSYLQQVSGVNIVLNEAIFPREEAGMGPVAGPSPRVTLRLTDIPLIEALDLILRTKGLAYRLEENIIWITTPREIGMGGMETRTYELPAGGTHIVETLEASLPQPEGSDLTLDRTTGTLIITNTKYNLEIAEDLLRALTETPYQIAIEARFVELNTTKDVRFDLIWDLMEAIKGLTDDSKLAIEYGPHTFVAFGSGRSLDVSVERLTPMQFDLTMQALISSGKAHMLSAPHVTTLNNEEAEIVATQRMPYVTNYRIENRDTEVAGNTFTQSTIIPDSVESRDVGITLRVRPSVGSGKKLINLTLQPQVVELAEWMEYGTRFVVRQPVFFLRRIRTSIVINDGETVVIGGLAEMKEEMTEYGVPILSKIPVIRSLFMTREKTQSKRNLIVFVTARILGPTGEPLVESQSVSAP